MNRDQIPGYLLYIRDEILPNYIGIIISHEIRIPINQPGFNGMSSQGFDPCSNGWAKIMTSWKHHVPRKSAGED